MIASWMIYATIVTALCAIVAALLEKVLRASNKPTRMIWLGAIAASLLLNATAIWRSQSAAQSQSLATQTGARAPATEPTMNSGGSVGLSTASRMPSSGVGTESWLSRSRNTIASNVEATWLALRSNALLQQLDATMLLLWGVASTITIALLAGSAIRLRRRRASWRRASVRGVPILVTDGIGPAVVGVVESEIAVPDWIFRLESSQQQLIVEHERQHLLARDPAVMLAALLAAAVVPWNAAMWLMVRRLRRSTEMDCDQRVLAAVPAPREYAALLVDIGSHSLPHASFGHALADPTSDLERRVSDILNGTKRIAAPAVAFRVAVSAALIIAACAAPAPRTDVEPKAAPAAPSAPPQAATTAADARSEPPTAATTRATPSTASAAAPTKVAQQPPPAAARGGQGSGVAPPVAATAAQQRDTMITATIAGQPMRGGVAATPPTSPAGARGVPGRRGGVAPGSATAITRGGFAVGVPPQIDSAALAMIMQLRDSARAGRGAPVPLAGARGAAGGRGVGTPLGMARGGGGQGAGVASGVASGAILGPGMSGGRPSAAGAAGPGRASVAPPAAAAAGARGVAGGGGRGVAGSAGRGAPGGGGFAVAAPPTPGGAPGSGRGASVQAGALSMRGTMSTSGTMSSSGSVIASSGTIKREGAVISNRIPSMDSVVVLAAKRFPQLFTEAAKTDSLTIVFALDTLGQVIMTASLPVPLQSWVSDIPRVEQIFLDIPQQEVKYGEWRSGTISARGLPTKRMSLLFVVFGRK